MVSRQNRIAIVGAGMGGLSVGVALQRLGFRVKIFERAPTLEEIGAGITIPPNARRGLVYLGLDEAVRAVAFHPREGAFKDYYTGETLERTTINAEADTGPDPTNPESIAGTLQMHRADLQDILVAAVSAHDASAIETNRECTGLSLGGGEVTLRFADGSQYAADAVIGCDGNQSAVRKALHGTDQLDFLGYGAWRGLIPTASLAPQLIEPDTASYIGTGKHFVRYFVRGGELVNYVAFTKTPGWKEEGWTVRSSIPELMAQFGDATEEIIRVIEKTTPSACFKWALVGREPLASWTRGHATLLGDAAHPMLPFLGQGAAMAIEDAVVLARAFELENDIPAALQRYEAARIERTRLVTLGARYNGTRLHGRVDDSMSDAAKEYSETKVAGYDPARVTI